MEHPPQAACEPTTDGDASLRHVVDKLRRDLAHTQARHADEQQRRLRTEQGVEALMAQMPFGLVTLSHTRVLGFNAAAATLMPHLQQGQTFSLPADWQRQGNSDRYTAGRNAEACVIQVDWLHAPNLDTQWVRLEDITAACSERDTRERQARLAAMGRLTAELAHQLRTPLCTATLYASMLADEVDDGIDRPLITRRLVHQLGQLDALIVRMLAFVKSRPRPHEVCAIEPLLQAQLDIVAPLLGLRGVQLALRCDAANCLVAVDQLQMGSALMALLENALQHAPPGSTLSVSCQALGHRVDIVVADQGPGVSAPMLPRLFEPFATERPSGTGLGLALARAAAEAHGGRLAYHHVMPQGAAFVLTLPALPQV